MSKKSINIAEFSEFMGRLEHLAADAAEISECAKKGRVTVVDGCTREAVLSIVTDAVWKLTEMAAQVSFMLRKKEQEEKLRDFKL